MHNTTVTPRTTHFPYNTHEQSNSNPFISNNYPSSFTRTTRHPSDSSAIHDLFSHSNNNDNNNNYNNYTKSPSQDQNKHHQKTTNESLETELMHFLTQPRIVPRPADSTQMLQVLDSNSFALPDLRTDAMLRRTSPTPPIPQEYPELTLNINTSPVHCRHQRNKATNLVQSSPTKYPGHYKEPPRVGDSSIVWDTKRDPIARKGYVKSNLPTLVGVRGLGTLNQSLFPNNSISNNNGDSSTTNHTTNNTNNTNNTNTTNTTTTTTNNTYNTNNTVTIINSPELELDQHQHHQLHQSKHPSANIHPTFLNQQQIRCLDNERVSEVLSTLRNQSHRPTLRYVQNGQGTAYEISRELKLEARKQRKEERLAFVDGALYSPVKTERKAIVDDSEWVSGSR